ncbi:hypothetical protein BV378_03980 [Nostoc sp. RF31YmG]|nr:hypothetical protein BV378_03980 [Nostoc sp. RF31YmG]
MGEVQFNAFSGATYNNGTPSRSSWRTTKPARADTTLHQERAISNSAKISTSKRFLVIKVQSS